MPHMPYHIPAMLPATHPRNAIQAKVKTNPVQSTNLVEIGLRFAPGAIGAFDGFATVWGNVSANVVPAKFALCSMRRSLTAHVLSVPALIPCPMNGSSIALQQGNDASASYAELSDR